MFGWAKGGRLKCDLAAVSAVDVGDGDGVEGSAVEAVDASDDPPSTAGSPSLLAATSATPSVSEEVSASGSIVGGASEVLGCCSIGIARQSTVKISPGFRSVFGLCTYNISTPFSRLLD